MKVLSVVSLIISVILIIFLVVAAVYFMNVNKGKTPSSTESMILFWMSIILGIVLLGLAAYSLYEMVKHKGGKDVTSGYIDPNDPQNTSNVLSNLTGNPTSVPSPRQQLNPSIGTSSRMVPGSPSSFVIQ